VVDVIVTGSNDVCVVRDGEREYLIPLIDDVIVELSPGEKIVVRPIPGLLDP
jgi:16S rRNA processing protein RimM